MKSGAGAPTRTEDEGRGCVSAEPLGALAEEERKKATRCFGADGWSARSASDDIREEEDANAIPRATDDESHYITTHEILLAELSDNEWAVEVDRSPRGTRGGVSNLRENDPRASAKSVGQIQLSISSSSRAINGPGRLYATPSADASGAAESKRRAPLRLAAAPGRDHLGPQSGAKDAPERSAASDDAERDVDMSQKRDETVADRHESTSAGYSGAAQAPRSKICAPSATARNRASSALLTETLNFRCNVKSGKSEGEKRTTRAPCSPYGEDVPDAPSKKAIFASSLIKNVIWKKMQFEQERKMERGEISEPESRGGAPCRRSSKASDSSSDCTLTRAESGDAANAGPARPSAPPGAETPPETGSDPKTGTAEASRRTLPRSQTSAFRRWKDDGAPSPDPSTPEGGGSASRGGKLTKMSHLFVPSIQLLPRESDASSAVSTAGAANAAKSRSPEIKINLRSVSNKRAEPEARAAGSKDVRCQTLTAALRGDSADKVPHFTVRDIRDNKAKLQTPIHQVRDVRKLVKSSYHFVSLDGDSRRPDAKRPPALKEPVSVSPMVIKCHSVNTNSGGKQPERRAGEPASAGGKVLPKRREKSPEPDRKPESLDSGALALEKLQAAVRTMEQLYVFDKNEWKRKADSLAPPPLALQAARPKAGGTLAPVSSAANANTLTEGSAGAQPHSCVVSSAPQPPVATELEGGRSNEPDHEGYLTFPVRSQCTPEATAAAAVYHAPPQLVCLSPALEPFQALPRKLLLDPATGSCYLLDSPAPPPTRRLFDPETGQYVDVAVPPPPATPVPLSVSPLALGPGAYGHAYMLYPGLAPALEAPFYVTTANGAQQQAAPSLPLQPVISFSSQQGPRILAPPSFDGATMSFVVEHR